MTAKEKKRGPGRPPVDKVLVGFKLSPAVAKGLRKKAKLSKRLLSDVAEEMFRSCLRLDEKETVQ